MGVVVKSPSNPGAWPALMRAETAAAYLDESSVESFRRGVGTIYPRPILVPRKGERWLKARLDEALDNLDARDRVRDIADLM